MCTSTHFRALSGMECCRQYLPYCSVTPPRTFAYLHRVLPVSNPAQRGREGAHDPAPPPHCCLAKRCLFPHLSLQGDAEDRLKLRKKAEEDARRKAEEEKQDMVLEEAEALARMVSRLFGPVWLGSAGSCSSGDGRGRLRRSAACSSMCAGGEHAWQAACAGTPVVLQGWAQQDTTGTLGWRNGHDQPKRRTSRLTSSHPTLLHLCACRPLQASWHSSL